MIKTAARSLRKDLDRAGFFWIVFVLSSMFMFMFFHLAMSDAIGVTFINSSNDLPTYLTVFNVGLCIVVIFLANDFYVKKKSGDLAVILICGGTYGQLVEFLLFQTGILMVLSIPAGIGLGYLCFPVLGMLFKSMSGCEVHLSFGLQSVTLTACVIILEVFWCTMLNLGYSYRNSILTLLKGQEKIKLKTPKGLTAPGVRWVYPALYFGCAALLYTCENAPDQMVFWGFARTAAMWGMINKSVVPWLERSVPEKWIHDGDKLVYMGLFREDLKMAKLYIILFIAAADILCCLTAGMVEKGSEFALCLLSFSSMIPLLGISLMFRFASEAAGRKNQFATLQKIGYTEEQIKNIVKKELLWLYGVTIGASLVYILNIAVRPDCRRQGVAGKLLQVFLDFARGNRLAFLTLEVRASNDAAIALYESRGFREAGRRKNYYEHPREDAVLMTLNLSGEGEEP